ncbi:NAD-dependent epimerase/dehydratase family protein [Clostridium sp. D2Q-14]|uniref:NAD-dependent epimerase/dehydratase family protein n=1 Tax=Anaeromonas gelatinilytica TaxID=2683194 RepID=UPI00193BD911|nr:NAD-dependent epimerase/dehydratase family protein [Anaeromonas gelatinilytica]MBS4535703.1 NAD-dependent epimerase/dehydratase family protein [Anaeromonas gelatinilytica]
MKNRIYLVTGAAGNLGSSVCSQLLEKDERIRALVLKGDPAAERVPKEVEIMIGDVTDTASLERFFTVEDDSEVIVIHCASIVTVSGDYSKKLYDVNVVGTQNIIDKCLEHKVKKFVYISSTSAIPELPNGQKITEVDHFSPDDIIGHYGKTKALASQAVMDAVNKKGLDASIVFPSGICGPHDYAYGPVANFIIDYVGGKMPGGVAGSFNAVDVRDLADGVISCCDKGHKGEGYIMGNTCVSMKEMYQIISRVSGAKEVKIILPIPVANVMVKLLGLGSKITGKPAILTAFMLYNLTRNNNFSSEKAKRELEYHTRPFDETIADMVKWLIEEGKIYLNVSINS